MSSDTVQRKDPDELSSSQEDEEEDSSRVKNNDISDEATSSQDDEDDGEDEDEDEDDYEPLLKYSRLGGSLHEIFSKGNCASALCVGERFLALGTHLGYLYILDFEGNIVKAGDKELSLSPHTETINDISIDISGEFVASCSNDGKVVVTHLYGKDSTKMEFTKTVKAVAIDPLYSRRTEKPICSGGKAGKLLVTKKGWFKSKQVTLDEGEGAIHAIKWHKNYISWANDQGIKVYDIGTEQRISKIARPDGAPRPDMFRCCIQWVSNDPIYGRNDQNAEGVEKIIIGWGQQVQVIVMKDRINPETKQVRKVLEILYTYKVDFFICGIAPYEQNLLILAYDDEQSDEDENQKSFKAPPPELMIVHQNNGKEIACDELTIKDYDRYFATDYRLEFNPQESTFYILSQKDIIIAKPRDADDHITFLVEHERYEEALRYAEEHESEIKVHSVKNLGKSNLNYLMSKGDYAEAARIVPAIAKDDKKTWEHWIFDFFHRNQLMAIIPQIPLQNPQLDSRFYEMILNEFLNNDLNQFHDCIQKWPKNLYKPSVIIARVEPQLREMEMSDKYPRETIDKLKKSLISLYRHERQYEKALGLYFELGSPDLFDYIEEFKLYPSVKNRVIQLLDFDEVRGLELLVTHPVDIPVQDVVEQLKDEETSGRSLKRLHLMKYLHDLDRKSKDQALPYHLLLVKLYAENDTAELCRFLKRSQSFNIDTAFQICETYLNIHKDPEDRNNLYKAHVFLHGSLGNNQQALQIIIHQLGDVDLAIEFVKDQQDKELWKDLINHSLKNGTFIAGLLDQIGEHISDHINPQELIKEIPEEMEIVDLKYKLAKIVGTYSLQKTLHERAQEILISDIKVLNQTLIQQQKKGIRVSQKTQCTVCKQTVSAQVPLISFFCGHCYHPKCYVHAAGDPNADCYVTGCILCNQLDTKFQDRKKKRR